MSEIGLMGVLFLYFVPIIEVVDKNNQCLDRAFGPSFDTHDEAKNAGLENAHKFVDEFKELLIKGNPKLKLQFEDITPKNKVIN